jgi:hypothetical protein
MIPTTFRWVCSSAEPTKFCDRSDGLKPPRSGRCASCKSPLAIREGLWGVYRVRPEGDEEYDPAEVDRVYSRHRQAVAWAAKYRRVVRWIEADQMHLLPADIRVPHAVRRRSDAA